MELASGPITAIVPELSRRRSSIGDESIVQLGIDSLDVRVLVQSVNEQTLLFREQMDSINSYIRFREIGDPLRERLREYFSYLLTTDTWRHEFRNEQTILEQLSPDLRRQVVLDVNDRAAVDALAASIHVDILINNAGCALGTNKVYDKNSY